MNTRPSRRSKPCESDSDSAVPPGLVLLRRCPSLERLGLFSELPPGDGKANPCTVATDVIGNVQAPDCGSSMVAADTHRKIGPFRRSRSGGQRGQKDFSETLT